MRLVLAMGEPLYDSRSCLVLAVEVVEGLLVERRRDLVESEFGVAEVVAWWARRWRITTQPPWLVGRTVYNAVDELRTRETLERVSLEVKLTSVLGAFDDIALESRSGQNLRRAVQIKISSIQNGDWAELKGVVSSCKPIAWSDDWSESNLVFDCGFGELINLGEAQSRIQG